MLSSFSLDSAITVVQTFPTLGTLLTADSAGGASAHTFVMDNVAGVYGSVDVELTITGLNGDTLNSLRMYILQLLRCAHCAISDVQPTIGLLVRQKRGHILSIRDSRI